MKIDFGIFAMDAAMGTTLSAVDAISGKTFSAVDTALGTLRPSWT